MILVDGKICWMDMSTTLAPQQKYYLIRKPLASLSELSTYHFRGMDSRYALRDVMIVAYLH